MDAFSNDDIEKMMSIIDEGTGFDRWQQERMAFAIRKHLPDIATMIASLHDEDRKHEPKLEGSPPACPRADRIRAVQATIWNNWLNGKKSGNQYGLTLEVWSDSEETIRLSKYSFKCQSALMPGKQLKSHIRKNMRGKERTYSVGEGYLETLDQLARKLEPNQWLGLLNTNIKHNGDQYQRGICYHDDQCVLLCGDPANAKIEKAVMYLNGEAIDINHFSDKPYGKKPFAPGVILQARVDLCDFFPLWSTNSLGDAE